MESCRLKARYITVDPEMAVEMSKITESGRPMIYPYRRVEMTYFTKPAGSSELTQNNLIKEGNVLPRRIFAALVDQDAFHGHLDMDPFNYQPFKTNYIALRVGSQIKPYTEIRCYPGENEYGEALDALLETTHSLNDREDIGIDPDTYHARNFIIGFDLTPTRSKQGESFELPQRKTVDLVWRLGESPTKTITMIVYAEYDAEIQIDAKRNVYKRDFAL